MGASAHNRTPENAQAREPTPHSPHLKTRARADRQDWLAKLNTVLLQDSLLRCLGVVYVHEVPTTLLSEALFLHAVAGGMNVRDAERVAVRRTRLAELLDAGELQKVAARRLGVGERMAKYDAAAIRDVVLGDFIEQARAGLQVEGAGTLIDDLGGPS